jgi:hypothetical protein
MASKERASEEDLRVLRKNRRASLESSEESLASASSKLGGQPSSGSTAATTAVQNSADVGPASSSPTSGIGGGNSSGSKSSKLPYTQAPRPQSGGGSKALVTTNDDQPNADVSSLQSNIQGLSIKGTRPTSAAIPAPTTQAGSAAGTYTTAAERRAQAAGPSSSSQAAASVVPAVTASSSSRVAAGSAPALSKAKSFRTNSAPSLPTQAQQEAAADLSDQQAAYASAANKVSSLFLADPGVFCVWGRWILLDALL